MTIALYILIGVVIFFGIVIAAALAGVDERLKSLQNTLEGISRSICVMENILRDISVKATSLWTFVEYTLKNRKER
jgi:uncharacterized protein YoxC